MVTLLGCSGTSSGLVKRGDLPHHLGPEAQGRSAEIGQHSAPVSSVYCSVADEPVLGPRDRNAFARRCVSVVPFVHPLPLCSTTTRAFSPPVLHRSALDSPESKVRGSDRIGRTESDESSRALKGSPWRGTESLYFNRGQQEKGRGHQLIFLTEFGFELYRRPQHHFSIVRFLEFFADIACIVPVYGKISFSSIFQ